MKRRFRCLAKCPGVFARASFLLALLGGGCLMFPAPLPPSGQFDQRAFRTPPSLPPLPSASHSRAVDPPTGRVPFHPPSGWYAGWFEAFSARLDYAATLGQPYPHSAPPLFMLDDPGGGIRAHLRTVGGGHVLMLAAPPEEAPVTVALHWADYNARTALLDPATGKTLVLRQEEDGSHRIAFVPSQTWIVCFGEFARNLVFDGIYAVPNPRREVARLDGPWRGGRLAPNVLPLAAGPPPERRQDAAAAFRYTVTVAAPPPVCELALCQPERYASVMVNGHEVAFSTNGWFACDAFRTADVAAFLKGGGNAIELVPAPPPWRDEDAAAPPVVGGAYLSGDFAVKDLSIAEERASFTGGDLVPQGYPFYAGTFALETSVDLPPPNRNVRHLLTFPGFGAEVLCVIVNGVIFDPLFTPPWETDITAALRPGQNTFRIEVTNDLRNLLGGTPSRKTPFGLLAPPVIVFVER